jgi:acyl-CoA synthetase (AMP-forming)/AMP-acid ligase II
VNIVRLLQEQSTARGGQPAVIDNSRGDASVWTFAELEAASACVAEQLKAAGLRPGEAVLLLQPVSAELYVIFTALLRSGLVAMFLDPAAGRKHIEACCGRLTPRALVGSARARLLRLVSPALRRIPLKFATDWPVPGATRLNFRKQSAAPAVLEELAPDTPGMVAFTSGSTGTPKATLRTHGFLLAQQTVLERSLQLTPGQVDLVTMPNFVLANLAAGVTSLIPQADLRAPGSVSPAALLRQILEQRPTRIGAAPALLERLAEYCLHNGVRLDGVDAVYTGGAPVFPQLLDKLAAVAPRAKVVAVYGSTEAEPIALLEHTQISTGDRAAMTSGRGLLAGKPDPAVDLAILRDGVELPAGGFAEGDFAIACTSPGEAGQVMVAGPHVQSGYLNGEGDRTTKFKVNGRIWHQTGDAGYLDETGRLWLLGRHAARIEDERGAIHPFQVECAAHQDPGVRRAALVAHERRRVLAVETSGLVDVSALKARLAWAGIDAVAVFPRLPVDPRHNSKIDYPALRSLMQSSAIY